MNLNLNRPDSIVIQTFRVNLGQKDLSPYSHVQSLQEGLYIYRKRLKFLADAAELVHCCEILAREKIVVFSSLGEEIWALTEKFLRR